MANCNCVGLKYCNFPTLYKVGPVLNHAAQAESAGYSFQSKETGIFEMPVQSSVTRKFSRLTGVVRDVALCDLEECGQVQGNLMDLATFPFLEHLGLQGTNVAGDIRDISDDQFPVIVESIDW